jgi:uncharacterized protein YecE (DUF72 family)
MQLLAGASGYSFKEWKGPLLSCAAMKPRVGCSRGTQNACSTVEINNTFWLETYSDGDLQRWAKRLTTTTWHHIYVYFTHEPMAPAYAQTLMQYV